MQSRQTKPVLVFITGTDTGVGKTLLTGSLLDFLRRRGTRAQAMKPFCSGGREDIEFLDALQPGELSPARLNPFFFPEPVAPLVSARRHRRRITLSRALRAIRETARGSEVLLIEGSGGLMVPLGEDYTALDLIRRLRCAVMVVARNRLGTLNHTLLTVRALRQARIQRIKVVLMELRPVRRRAADRDVSVLSNLPLLRELLAPVTVFRLPYLGAAPVRARSVRKNRKIIQKVLAEIWELDSF